MAAQNVHQQFAAEVIRLGGTPPPDERTMELFLYPNKGDAAVSARQYVGAMKFRADIDSKNIKINDVDQSLRARLVDILANTDLPGHPIARDRKGRPIFHYIGRNIIPGTLAPVDILRQVVYKMEYLDKCFKEGPTEEVLVIADFKGWTMANVSPQIEKIAQDIMHQRYPGHFGPTLVLNAPWYFRVAFKLAKTFMPKESLDRFVMIQDNSRLLEYVDASNLPVEYGGSMHFDMDAWIKNRYVVEGIPYGTPPTHKISSEIYSEMHALGMSAQDLSMTAIKSGSLDKRGAGVGFFGTTSWKKRYFVVTGTQLIYFDSGKGHDAHRCWDIRGAIVEPEIPDRPFGFAVSFTTGRRLMLAASSDEERREWLDVLEPIVAM